MKDKFLMVILSALTMAGILEGCRSAKKIQKVISITPRKDSVTTGADTGAVAIRDLKADSDRVIRESLAKLNRNYIGFKTFSAKMKVHYEGGDGKDYDFNAFIRIEKDSIIWVSVNALLGIEAFRVLITRDSVKVKNNLDKIIQFRSVSYLQEIAHVPFDFYTLQDLLIGNPIYLDSGNIAFYRNEQSGLSLLSLGSLFKNYLTLNPDYTLKHSKLDDADAMRARTCDLTYGDYEQRDSLRFSTYRKISVAEKSKLDIQFNYKQYNFNENLSFPFPVPRNYKSK